MQWDKVKNVLIVILAAVNVFLLANLGIRIGQEQERKAALEASVRTLAADLSGHAGGDIRMVEEFLEMLAAGGQPSGTLSTLEASIESHLAALAAEHSRKHGGASVEIASMRGL